MKTNKVHASIMTAAPISGVTIVALLGTAPICATGHSAYFAKAASALRPALLMTSRS